jgi:MFS family permease
MGIASWFLGMGLQAVMIPTLAAVYLRVSASELALAQVSISIPQIILLFFSGRIADRNDGRKMLILIHGLGMLPGIMIFWLVWTDNLNYWHLIVFGLSMGCLFAFSAPTRDSLLTRVAPKNIQQGVMASMITQFIAQLIGFSLAGIAAPLAGPWTLPAMHTIAVGLGLYAAWALPSYPALSDEHGPAPTNSWLQGLKTVVQSETLFPVLLLNFAVGICFVGVFMVSLPLIVRDVFNGGQLEISIISFCFWGGSIATALSLLFLKPIHNRGKFMCLGTILGAIALLLTSLAPTFLLMCLACAAWGICAGFNMTMSRTIVQVAAPPRMRAQVLALLMLCFMGAAPLGAFAMGYLSPIIGPQIAPAISSVVMIVFGLTLVLTTKAWSIVKDPNES